MPPCTLLALLGGSFKYSVVPSKARRAAVEGPSLNHDDGRLREGLSTTRRPRSARRPRCYSTFAPEALITGARRFSSSARKASVSARLIHVRVAPCWLKASMSRGLSSAFLVSAESFSTIAGGRL